MVWFRRFYLWITFSITFFCIALIFSKESFCGAKSVYVKWIGDAQKTEISDKGTVGSPVPGPETPSSDGPSAPEKKPPPVILYAGFKDYDAELDAFKLDVSQNQRTEPDWIERDKEGFKGTVGRKKVTCVDFSVISSGELISWEGDKESPNYNRLLNCLQRNLDLGGGSSP